MDKKLLVVATVAAVALSSGVFAAEKQGFYVGVQGGASRADDGSSLKDTTERYRAYGYEWKEGGFGWRALAGYQINRNFTVEGGYSRFADNNYKVNGGYNLTQKVAAWDLVGKAILPVGDGNFDIYAKAGAAYQINKFDGLRNGSVSNKKFLPVAGIGAAYNFDNGLAVDVSWTRVFGNNDSTLTQTGVNRYHLNIGQPNSDLVAVGLTYTFQQWA
ncbi:MAG: ompA [Gammaproteobacteria bacterium]|jgi:hypothetical protein|nr:ompA [Gammaproteobacteria bacterium]